MRAPLQTAKKGQNKTTRLIFDRFRKRFPGLPDQIEKSVYQYLPGAIRVRIIDPSFEGRTLLQRELLVEDIPNRCRTMLDAVSNC